MTPLLIFTDIDGTLIDFATYSFAEVADTVKMVVARQVPLILCSSKTRAEQESLRQALAISDPFIVENGSAIFVPPGTFPFAFAHRWVAGWQVIELGIAAATIQTALMAVRQETGLVFQGYADLSLTEIAHKTGLAKIAAAQAQQREYSETIVTPLSVEALAQLKAALAERGLTIVSGGRFHTVMGVGSDKGRAVTHLTAIYRQKLGNIVTIGLGDSANDQPLLRAVDRPYLVQKPDETWQAMDGVEVERVPAVGPRGWRLAVEREVGVEFKSL